MGGAGGNVGLIETGGAGLFVEEVVEAGTVAGGGAGGNIGLIDTGGAGLTAGGGGEAGTTAEGELAVMLDSSRLVEPA